MALVTRIVLAQGRRAGVWTAIGVNVGVLLWSISAALGLAAGVARSATVFTTIKLREPRT